MINTREFHVEHLASLNKREVYKAFHGLDEQYTKLSSSENVVMYTICDDDRPIAVVGANMVWPGFMMAWGILSDDIVKKPIAFTKEIKRLFDVHFEELSLYRVSMEVKADFCPGVKWMRLLGFDLEGTMKKWGPDKSDYYLFARVC
jgi:hypothetical protein